MAQSWDPMGEKGKKIELKQGVEHLALSGPRQIWMGTHRGMCSQAVGGYYLFPLPNLMSESVIREEVHSVWLLRSIQGDRPGGIGA